MYRKEVFQKLKGFNEDDKMYSFEEFEFNLRCLMNGFKIGYCDKPLAYYRRHPKQIIRTVDNRVRKKYRQELVNSYL
jgi:GT2 family glycosyltransferase